MLEAGVFGPSPEGNQGGMGPIYDVDVSAKIHQYCLEPSGHHSLQGLEQCFSKAFLHTVKVRIQDTSILYWWF